MGKTERDDHAMFELVHDPHTTSGKTLRITQPNQVLPIRDKKELHHQLQHYAGPFIRHQLPDSTFARKRYILYVRPALRYYCAKFGVKVPKWLEDDSYFESLPAEEKQSLFGTTKLRFNGQFAPIKRGGGVQGQVHR